MNFYHAKKNCYKWFPMISGHGSERLFSMGIEMLGLGNAGSGSPFQTLQLYNLLSYLRIKFQYFKVLKFAVQRPTAPLSAKQCVLT